MEHDGLLIGTAALLRSFAALHQPRRTKRKKVYCCKLRSSGHVVQLFSTHPFPHPDRFHYHQVPFINNASLADMYTTAHTTVPSLPPSQASPENSTGQPVFIRAPSRRIRQTPANLLGQQVPKTSGGAISNWVSQPQPWDALCVKPLPLPLSNVNLERVPQD